MEKKDGWHILFYFIHIYIFCFVLFEQMDKWFQDLQCNGAVGFRDYCLGYALLKQQVMNVYLYLYYDI